MGRFSGAAGRRKNVLYEYFQAVILAIAIALVVRHFAIEAYRIPSDAMYPTLKPGDYIFINKLSYFSTIPFTEIALNSPEMPRRGDVVVFNSPVEDDKRYIKRVIGLPRDTLEFTNKGIVLNGKLLNSREAGSDEYLEPTSGAALKGMLYERDIDGRSFRSFQSFALVAAKGTEKAAAMTVPDGSLFVMGDNRGASVDSRHFGFVPIKKLKGEAMFVSMSWDSHKKRVRWQRLGLGIR